MGGVLSLASMGCCLTGTCVSTTCAICPSSCGNSGLAKFMYALVLLVTVVISCIMLAPGVETWLNKSPFCEQTNPGEHSSVHQGKDLGQQFTDFGKQLVGQASNIVVPKLPCADAIGYLAVYRICFVVAGKSFKSLLTFKDAPKAGARKMSKKEEKTKKDLTEVELLRAQLEEAKKSVKRKVTKKAH